MTRKRRTKPDALGAVKTDVHEWRAGEQFPSREYAMTLVLTAPVDELLVILEACSGKPVSPQHP